jgi:SAM-dependent methyltransferase
LKDWIRRLNGERRELGPLALWELKELTSNVLNRSDHIYRFRLRRRYRPDFSKLTLPPMANAVLATKKEADEAWANVEQAGLPHAPGAKDWDSLIAFREVVTSTNRFARVLDAGAELWSAILPWLHLYGYNNLVGANLVFRQRFYRGSIVYEYGDITRTHYRTGEFDAVTCLSVVEHDVPISPFFAEMSRILKTGARLILSTDFWNPKIDTKDAAEEYYRASKHAYEASPWTVFSEGELQSLIDCAAGHGLRMTSTLDMRCREAPVQYLGRRYTFVCLTFVRS